MMVVRTDKPELLQLADIDPVIIQPPRLVPLYIIIEIASDGCCTLADKITIYIERSSQGTETRLVGFFFVVARPHRKKIEINWTINLHRNYVRAIVSIEF